ncbi:MAG: flavoredoxin [Spirochaetae bacterium HGW-Spirochaetae-8]|jgi:flavin reductase (DIM6/NTAB) family NADH-FMN oxidoreductase RutF|nr:MAG: flavoredoxin [Spirochaetae bacterium HGW-Spirochaetae-8]
MFQTIDYATFEFNPFTSIGNDAFLITAGDSGAWNTMTASWGLMGYLWNRPTFSVVVRDSRYTYEFMEKADGFTCSFFPPEWKEALTFCGTHSGREIDKAAATGLVPVATPGPAGIERVTFEQANLVFSCTKASRVPFNPGQFVIPNIDMHYPHKDYHCMYIGFIDEILIQAE